MPSRFTRAGARHPHRPSTIVLVALAGVIVLAVASVAVARSFTLRVGRNATVTNLTAHTTTHEAIVVNAKGFAVYWLTGDSKKHQKCVATNGCFQVWPPVTAVSVKSLGKAPGIRGKLTSWRRDGFVQAVLNGHPLYTFAPDRKRNDATGEGVVGFGGTWHVEVPGAGSKATKRPPSSSPNPYPNGY